MIIQLSSGYLLNLDHVAIIKPMENGARVMQVRLACGQHDAIPNVTEQDYKAIVKAISKGPDDSSGGKPDQNTPSAKHGARAAAA